MNRPGSSSNSRVYSNDAWSLDWKSTRKSPRGLAVLRRVVAARVGDVVEAALPGELADDGAAPRPRAEAQLAEAAPDVGAAHVADLGPEVAVDQHVLGGGAVAIVGVVEPSAVAGAGDARAAAPGVLVRA